MPSWNWPGAVPVEPQARWKGTAGTELLDAVVVEVGDVDAPRAVHRQPGDAADSFSVGVAEAPVAVPQPPHWRTTCRSV
jgi:hypothetical protein